MTGVGRSGKTPGIDATPADLVALVQRVQDGDQEAFAALYDHLAPALHGAATRLLRDAQLAEDVTQEAFVELWTTANRYDHARGSVLAWAITIVRRRAIDRIRREESQRDRIGQLATRRTDLEPETGETVIASIEAKRVSRALLLLPPDQREVVRLAFLDGHSHAAIAERLHLPLGTVKGRVRGALHRLAAVLQEDA